MFGVDESRQTSPGVWASAIGAMRRVRGFYAQTLRRHKTSHAPGPCGKRPRPGPVQEAAAGCDRFPTRMPGGKYETQAHDRAPCRSCARSVQHQAERLVALR